MAERAEGDGQRHDHVAGHARGVGARPHPGHAARRRRPTACPAVEPDIRGATTIREQLAKHRESPSCNSCHAKIDPPGFALESFDVIGGWRDHYRSPGSGEPVVIDGRRMRYRKGPKVEPADVLADGRRFADIDELKQLLLTDKDQLARCLAGKLLTYATGRAPTRPTSRTSKPSSRGFATSITVSARWFTKSCRASCCAFFCWQLSKLPV